MQRPAARGGQEPSTKEMRCPFPQRARLEALGSLWGTVFSVRNLETISHMEKLGSRGKRMLARVPGRAKTRNVSLDAHVCVWDTFCASSVPPLSSL